MDHKPNEENQKYETNESNENVSFYSVTDHYCNVMGDPSSSDKGLAELKANLQAKLDAAFDPGTVTVGDNGGKLTLTSSSKGTTSKVEIGTASGTDAKGTLFGTPTTTNATGTNAVYNLS